jgi:hypothetical protein
VYPVHGSVYLAVRLRRWCFGTDQGAGWRQVGGRGGHAGTVLAAVGYPWLREVKKSNYSAFKLGEGPNNSLRPQSNNAQDNP